MVAHLWSYVIIVLPEQCLTNMASNESCTSRDQDILLLVIFHSAIRGASNVILFHIIVLILTGEKQSLSLSESCVLFLQESPQFSPLYSALTYASGGEWIIGESIRKRLR